MRHSIFAAVALIFLGALNLASAQAPVNNPTTGQDVKQILRNSLEHNWQGGGGINNASFTIQGEILSYSISYQLPNSSAIIYENLRIGDVRSNETSFHATLYSARCSKNGPDGPLYSKAVGWVESMSNNTIAAEVYNLSDCHSNPTVTATKISLREQQAKLLDVTIRDPWGSASGKDIWGRLLAR